MGSSSNLGVPTDTDVTVGRAALRVSRLSAAHTAQEDESRARQEVAPAFHWLEVHGRLGSDMRGMLSDDRVSPVNWQRRTRDVARFVAAQPNGDARNLYGLGAAEHRGPVDARGR